MLEFDIDLLFFLTQFLKPLFQKPPLRLLPRQRERPLVGDPGLRQPPGSVCAPCHSRPRRFEALASLRDILTCRKFI